MVRGIRKMAMRVALPVMSMAMMLATPNAALASEPVVVTEDTFRGLFDDKFYAANNPDVVNVYGDAEEDLWRHYMDWGIHEGRSIDELFDIRAYRAGNADLEAAFGGRWEEYLKHYFQFGLDEIIAGKRTRAGMLFNPAEYASYYRDVFLVYGNDWAGIMEHYLTRGKAEGRTVGMINAEDEGQGQVGEPPVLSQPLSQPTSRPSGGHSSGSSGSSGGSSSSTPRHDESSTHSLGDFVNGKCRYGCGLTLAGFQQACTANGEGHADLAEGEVCGNCGYNKPVSGPNPGTTPKPDEPAKPDPDKPGTEEPGPDKPGTDQPNNPGGEEPGPSGPDGPTTGDPVLPDPDKPGTEEPGPDKPGTEEPDPEEPKQHVHDWVDGVCFGEGECPGCPNEDSHDDILLGDACEICGLAGTKVPVATPSNPEKPGKPDEPDKPSGPSEPEEPDTPEGHPDGYEHTKADFDENGKCTTEGCTVTLEEFQRECKVDHDEILLGEFCPNCGAEGTKVPVATPSNPEKPEQPDPEEPDPDEPEGHPEWYKHELTDFDLTTGRCTTVGCTKILREFQEECDVNHAEILVGEHCEVCWAEGTKVPIATPSNPEKPDPEEPEEPEDPCADGHDWSKQDGFCVRCDLECPNADNHGDIFEEHHCEICGFLGSKHEWSGGICVMCGMVCPNIRAGKHVPGMPCEICGYKKPTPPTPDTPEGHPDGYEHTKADFDENGKCTTEGCTVTLEEFQRECKVDHDEILLGEFCPNCGAEGTKEIVVEQHSHNKDSFNADGACKTEGCDITLGDFQAICSHRQIVGDTCLICGAVLDEICIDADEHEFLHKGQKCPTCGVVGVASHTFVNGVCECGAVDEDYVASEDERSFADEAESDDKEVVGGETWSSEDADLDATDGEETRTEDVVGSEQFVTDEDDELLDEEQQDEEADSISDEDSEEITEDGGGSVLDSEAIEDDGAVINGDDEKDAEVEDTASLVEEESDGSEQEQEEDVEEEGEDEVA